MDKVDAPLHKPPGAYASLTVPGAVAYALIYFVAIEVGLKLFLAPSNVSTFWPAAGLALGALLISKQRHWVLLLIIAAAMETLSDVLHGRAAAVTMLYRFPNAISALGAAVLVRRWVPNFRPEELRSIVLVSLAGVCSTAVGALFGAFTYLQEDPQASFGAVWQVWWLADACGILTLTPFTVVWWNALRRRPAGQPLPDWWRIAALLLAAAAVTHGVLGPHGAKVLTVVEYPYLLTLGLVMVALYWRPLMVQTLLAVVVLIAVAETAAGNGMLAAQGLAGGRGVIALQVFVGVSTVLTHLVMAVMHERERGRRELASAERSLSSVFQALPSAVALLQVDGSKLTFVSANSSFLEELGCKAEALLGHQVDELPDIAASRLSRLLVADYQRCARQGTLVERAHQLSLSQSTRHILHQLIPLRDVDDRLVRIVASATDVTPLKLAERRLEESERLAKMGSVEWDMPTGAVRMSSALFELGGLDESESDGGVEQLLKYHHPDDLEAFRAAHTKAMTSRQTVEADYRIVTKAGDIRHVHSVIKGRYGPDGKARGTLAVVRDVTDVTLAEARAEANRRQLVEAEKLIALGTLVAGVAHEVNNPNHFIMLNAALLRDVVRDALPILDAAQAADPGLQIAGMPVDIALEEVPAAVEAIADGSQRIKSLVDELRNYTSDQREHAPDVAINDVVRSALPLIGTTIKKATHRFSAEYGDGIVEIHGQRGRLQQVVMNLVLNACQALTSPNGRVWVRTRYDAYDDGVVIEVEDDGCGMDDATRKRMSEPFFTTKREQGGMGFGMAVVSRIVSDHGGKLQVTSAPGQGTIVAVRLPRSRPAADDR